MPITVEATDAAATVRRNELGWPTAPAPVEAFLAARAAALRAIRDDDDLILEGRDLRALRPVAQAYAEAYRELLCLAATAG